MEWINNVGYAYEHVANLGDKWIPKDTTYVNPDFQMPQSINGEQLIAVGTDGFACNQRLKFFNANPANDLYLMERSFANCENLEAINLNGNLNKTSVHLYSHTFCSCHSLKSVQSIRPTYFYGSQQFANCASLETVDLRVMDKIPGGCFWKCRKLKKARFSHFGEIHIADNAFSKCIALEELTFYGSVKASELLLNQLKNVLIRCPGTSNLAELAYQGWKIEIF